MAYIPDEYAQKAIDAINAKTPFIFITGKAGSGKSTLIRHLTETLDRNYMILATTGIAALNIGGSTIHKVFRFPPRMISPHEIKGRTDDIAKKN